jgi:hypothetical protein
MICRHCEVSRASRPRGLCWRCYYTPAVRDLYPSTSKYARQGVGNFSGNTPLPALPTDAVPGSEEKVRVLMLRAEKGVSLWHPDDADRAGPKVRSPRLQQVG